MTTTEEPKIRQLELEWYMREEIEKDPRPMRTKKIFLGLAEDAKAIYRLMPPEGVGMCRTYIPRPNGAWWALIATCGGTGIRYAAALYEVAGELTKEEAHSELNNATLSILF